MILPAVLKCRYNPKELWHHKTPPINKQKSSYKTRKILQIAVGTEDSWSTVIVREEVNAVDFYLGLELSMGKSPVGVEG